MTVLRRVAGCVLALIFLASVAMLVPARSGAAGGQAGGAPAALAPVAAKVSCADLVRVDLSGAGGAGSHVATAAEATGKHGEAVCAVEGTLSPAIDFRAELPIRTWTQRYLQTGCGGLCGNVRINAGASDGCPTLAAGGFVLATTDMGHHGMDGAWTHDPGKRADFAFRGVHVTALATKALIRAFYGQDAHFNYFDGCSDGGREALVEAQRFPQDFDGIIAGAPAMAFTVQNSLFHGWQARSNTGADGKAILLAGRLPILHAAVLQACDALDGVKDGLVSAPTLCRFDPASIVCAAGQEPSNCLTAAEAGVARRFYQGPRDPRTGERLTQGGPQPGSELQWAGVYVPAAPDQPVFSTMIVNGALPLLAPNGKPAVAAAMAFDRATFDTIAQQHTLYDATDPDPSAFRRRGGKLILFHGWADPHISPLNTIAYHDAVRRTMGARVADGFERLYLLPGMGHCSGGEGPSAFDLLTPLMAWVESRRAPDAIATRTAAPEAFGRPDGVGAGGRGGPGGADGRPGGPPPGAMPPPPSGPARSRPVYPYPYVAAYTGRGDPNDGANWSRGREVPAAVPTWAGSKYFSTYAGPTG